MRREGEERGRGRRGGGERRGRREGEERGEGGERVRREGGRRDGGRERGEREERDGWKFQKYRNKEASMQQGRGRWRATTTV